MLGIVKADGRKIPLADESVQCVVTSPPYWGLRKYAGEQELVWGGREDCEHGWGGEIPGDPRGGSGPAAKECYGGQDGESNYARQVGRGNECLVCGAWRGAYGLEPTVNLYVQHTVEILREIRRVLRADGVVFWNIGDSYAASNRGSGGHSPKQDSNRGSWTPGNHRNEISDGLKPKDLCLIPFRVALAAQADGWWVRSDIIWAKPNPMPESVTDRPTRSHEYILMLTKSARYYFDSFAVREPVSTGAANGTPFSRSALTPETDSALNTNDRTPNLRGRCYLRENEITISGTMAWQAKSFEVFKTIRLTVIGKESELSYVMDLRAHPRATPLAHLAVAFERLAADNAPIRATIVNPSASKCRAIDARAVDAVPPSETLLATESSLEPGALLAGIASEGRSAAITFDGGALGEALFIFGTFRPSHVPHHTRNIRSVWDFSAQNYSGAHFATFPEELPKRCILAATKLGDLVLDPFAGSGTVGKVAIELGRRAILCDLAYQDLASKRTAAIQRPLIAPAEAGWRE